MYRGPSRPFFKKIINFIGSHTKNTEMFIIGKMLNIRPDRQPGYNWSFPGLDHGLLDNFTSTSIQTLFE